MCATLSDRKASRQLLLVEHCLAFGLPQERPPAKDRLEAVLGQDLTHRLVFALTRPDQAGAGAF
jgi:hypothetical protein